MGSGTSWRSLLLARTYRALREDECEPTQRRCCSKGPRFRFLCEEHLKLPKKKQGAARWRSGRIRILRNGLTGRGRAELTIPSLPSSAPGVV
jgi:hypothetical protein